MYALPACGVHEDPKNLLSQQYSEEMPPSIRTFSLQEGEPSNIGMRVRARSETFAVFNFRQRDK